MNKMRSTLESVGQTAEVRINHDGFIVACIEKVCP